MMNNTLCKLEVLAKGDDRHELLLIMTIGKTLTVIEPVPFLITI